MLDLGGRAKEPGTTMLLLDSNIVTALIVIIALFLTAVRLLPASALLAKSEQASEAQEERPRRANGRSTTANGSGEEAPQAVAPPADAPKAVAPTAEASSIMPSERRPTRTSAGQSKVYVVKYTAEIYASVSSWDIVGELQEGEEVTLSGPPVACDGYTMVPVEPRGVVDFGVLEPKSERFLDSVVAASQREIAVQVRAISMEAFGEDAMQSARGERVAALLLRDEVVAYASYTVRPQLGAFNVNKFAVASARRRQGLGRGLVRQLVQLARRGGALAGTTSKAWPRSAGAQAQPLEVVCLSALPTAITFYQSCGFKADSSVRLSEDGNDAEDLIEGQVYMEYRLRRSRK
mmetsp:Transcript_7123/g.18210  ORF Transcript_7123/g.18210 Transcript_7123/m.18210 type:complete len:349 (-) Transcript_7123:201-1247(-)